MLYNYHHFFDLLLVLDEKKQMVANVEKQLEEARELVRILRGTEHSPVSQVPEPAVCAVDMHGPSGFLLTVHSFSD